MLQQLWETIWQFLIRLDTHLTHGPIPWHSPWTDESLRCHRRSTQMFAAAKPGKKRAGHYAATKRGKLPHDHVDEPQRRCVACSSQPPQAACCAIPSLRHTHALGKAKLSGQTPDECPSGVTGAGGCDLSVATQESFRGDRTVRYPDFSVGTWPTSGRRTTTPESAHFTRIKIYFSQ